MKTRLQKTGESLQEYASEVETLANLAFSDHPATVLPDNEKPHYKILQITAVNGGDKGLYVIGQINNISCRMDIDIGAKFVLSGRRPVFPCRQ
ncbi:hypothetical protein TNCV_4897161 [Trichonephila clavipes]|nr:hypothetical protein TNCV_4897161 [Trichonephila clavipes]